MLGIFSGSFTAASVFEMKRKGPPPPSPTLLFLGAFHLGAILRSPDRGTELCKVFMGITEEEEDEISRIAVYCHTSFQ